MTVRIHQIPCPSYVRALHLPLHHVAPSTRLSFIMKALKPELFHAAKHTFKECADCAPMAT